MLAHLLYATRVPHFVQDATLSPAWALRLIGNALDTLNNFTTLRAVGKLQLKLHTCRPFHPEEFSVQECQEAITAAFRSRASVAHGAKVFKVSPHFFSL